ncbi:MAG: NADH-quinone oxidoreductase subunit NuoE [Sphingomonadales bacterium]
MNDATAAWPVKTALKEKIEEIATRYPNRRSAIMPALFLAQEENGHLSGEVLRKVADILDVAEIWVYEVATFYSLFHIEPLGKFHIQLCTNVSCLLSQAGGLLAYLEKRLGIAPGDTTDDGLFTLSTVECLGSCDTAPVLMVNDAYFENMSERRVDEMLDDLTARARD